MRCFEPGLRALALLAAACAAGHVAVADTRTAAKSEARASSAADKSKARTAAPKRRPARFEAQDGTAFTITEQARISGEARAQYDSALQLLDRERYSQAIPLLLEVADKAPDVTAPYINLGIAYGRLGDFERAETNLKKALELNPSHPVVYDELGLLYRETGRFAAARQSYEKALEIYPGFHFAHRNLGILCDIYLNDLPCALTHYEAYSRAEPDDKEVPKWIADLHTRTGH
jgi:Flp pilus assembly protein TadD